MKYIVKSPLRYPGGKSKALKEILPLIPSNFKEFREPMVGGGSVFIALKQLYPKKKFWINDISQDLYSFWVTVKNDLDKLAENVYKIYSEEKNGKKLYMSLKEEDRTYTNLDRAIRFFILNRITFSGTADSGGYSQLSFEKRFTKSSIQRLEELNKIINGVKITDFDYENIVNEKGRDVFIFLDPPYYSAAKSKLYGKNGDLHTGFDHERFARVMKNCKHRWLITYDDSEEIRALFPFANTMSWELQYGMNNYKKNTAAKGKELFIANYRLPRKQKETQQLEFFFENTMIKKAKILA